MARKPSLVGQMFGRLTVLADAGSRRYGQTKTATQSSCRCACGNVIVVTNSHLRSGHTQSCGCLQRDRCSLPHGVANDNLAVDRIKRSARARRLEWNLDDAFVRSLLAAPCHWCGDVRVNKFGGNFRFNGKLGYNGLDRLDSSKGYIATNVVPCCGPCNRMKGTQSTDDFEARCMKIASRRQLR